MLSEPVTAEPDAAPGPSDQDATGRGRLLGLVRKILGYGRDLVASLQRQNMPAPSLTIARRFGTFNLALIIARITRGLAIAARLEVRLARTPPTRAVAQSSATRNPSAQPRTARPPEPSQAEDDAALLRGLPSAEEIAARIRRRPAGAVIVEICRDLGIDTQHKLWRDIQMAIIEYDGSLVRLLKIWTSRTASFIADRVANPMTVPSPMWDGLLWDTPLDASTGPP